MREEEAALVVEITRACPEAAQWSERDYVAVLSRQANWDGVGPAVLVVEVASELVAFAAIRTTADEMEILNVGVSPAARRVGHATRLLDVAFDTARKADAKIAFCEVRESNAAARAFYAAHGFTPAGRRSRYYSDPMEDALVLSRKL